MPLCTNISEPDTLTQFVISKGDAARAVNGMKTNVNASASADIFRTAFSPLCLKLLVYFMCKFGRL